MGRDNYFESMTGRNGRKRRDLAEDNDERIVKNSISESFDIPEMKILESVMGKPRGKYKTREQHNEGAKISLWSWRRLSMKVIYMGC